MILLITVLELSTSRGSHKSLSSNDSRVLLLSIARLNMGVNHAKKRKLKAEALASGVGFRLVTFNFPIMAPVLHYPNLKLYGIKDVTTVGCGL